MDAKRLRLMYKFCPHCSKQCKIKRYNTHKRLYFNAETKVWIVEPSTEDPDHSSLSREPEEHDTDSSLSLESDEESIVEEAPAETLSPGSSPGALEPTVDVPSVEEDEPRRGAEEG